MFTDEFLRVIIQDREREVQQRLQVPRVQGTQRATVRWFDRNGQRIDHGQSPARGR